MNLTSIHEVAGLILGLLQWVRVPVLLWTVGWVADSAWSLRCGGGGEACKLRPPRDLKHGTSHMLQLCPKKEKKKKKSKKKKNQKKARSLFFHKLSKCSFYTICIVEDRWPYSRRPGHTITPWNCTVSSWLWSAQSYEIRRSKRCEPNSYFHKRSVLLCFTMLVHLPSDILKKNERNSLALPLEPLLHYPSPVWRTKVQRLLLFYGQ